MINNVFEVIEPLLMSENKLNNDSNQVKKSFSYKQLRNMSHMEIVSNYFEYPQKNLKFKHHTLTVPESSVSKNTVSLKNIPIQHGVIQSKFLSEQEKADGYQQNFSKSTKFSKFLQTNLHYLPEHLWEKLSEVYENGVHVGYKAKDNSVTFFVHMADTDSTSMELFKELKHRYTFDRQKVQQLVDTLTERDIDSWLTIRAKSYLH